MLPNHCAIKKLILPLCLISVSVFAAEQPGAIFDAKNLSAWKQPVGDWQTAKEVSLDPANNKKLAIVAGEGVLVNGPKGTTKNLIRQIEHEAQISSAKPR